MSLIRLSLLLLLGCCFSPLVAQNAESEDGEEPKIEKKKSVVNKSAKETLVMGKVIDASTMLPVNAAEISVEGYSSAISSPEGEFSIRVPYSTEMLRVEADGFQVAQVGVKGKLNIVIQLVSNAFAAKQEVILFEMGEKRTIDFPFSMSQSSNFSPLLGSSIEERLQLELPEIRTIVRSGAPGIGGNMFIRGLNSLNGTSQPLIVLDGVPFETLLDKGSVINGNFSNPLMNINQEEIESVSVIKDGYALYGMKGANGVILINTKRAKSETSKITASASWGINVTPKKTPVLGAKEYRAFASEQMGSANFTQTDIKDQLYLDEDPTKPYYNMYHNDTDWQDEVFQNGLVQNYNGSVLGGDEIAKYALFLGYTGIESTLKGSNLNRFNSRFNADIDLTPTLLFSTGLALSQVNKYVKDDGAIERSSTSYLSLIKSPLVSPNLLADDGSRLATFADQDFWNISNPAAIIANGIGENKQYRLNLWAKLNYKIGKDFKVSGLFSYDFDKLKENYFIPDYGVADLSLETNGGEISKNVAKGRAGTYVSLFGVLDVNYSKTFNFIHKFDATAAMRYQSQKYESNWALGHNTGEDKFIFLATKLKSKEVYQVNTESKWVSAFVDLDYTLLNRYKLTATVSSDGTSRAGSNKQFGIFPSVGASWLLSSEQFMKEVTPINLLQFRASMGIVGSDDLGEASSKESFGSTNYLSMAGLKLKELRNKDLKWETTTKTNVGLDLAFFNDRVSIAADLYANKTKDLVTLQTIDQVSGFDYAFINGGELKNNGFELALGLRAVDTKSFKFGVRASISKYKNELTSLPKGNKDIFSTAYGATILSRVGESAGLFYGYKTEGVFSTAKEAHDANLTTLYNKTTTYHFEAGDVHFVDTDQNGQINEKDMQIIGDPNPDFYGTFGLYFTYKSVTLDALFSGVSGNDVYNSLRAQTESMSSFNNQSNSVLNRWMSEGQITNVPRAFFGDPRGNARFSDRWIEDGSYLRLKNVTLTWECPKKVFFLDGLSIFASATNLFVITNYLGADPEFSPSNQALFQGIDTGYLSQGRSFMAGFKINL